MLKPSARPLVYVDVKILYQYLISAIRVSQISAGRPPTDCKRYRGLAK